MTTPATPAEPRTAAEMGPIERRFAEAWHDLNCGTDHPITEHEPFDRDEGDIPWSEFTAVLFKHGLQVIEAAGVPLLREALDIIDHINGCHGCLDNGSTEDREAVERLRAALAAAAPTVEQAHRKALAQEPLCSTENELGSATDWCVVHGCEWPGERGVCAGYLDAAFRRSNAFFAEPQRAAAGLGANMLALAMEEDGWEFTGDPVLGAQSILDRAAGLAAEASAKEER